MLVFLSSLVVSAFSFPHQFQYNPTVQYYAYSPNTENTPTPSLTHTSHPYHTQQQQPQPQPQPQPQLQPQPQPQPQPQQPQQQQQQQISQLSQQIPGPIPVAAPISSQQQQQPNIYHSYAHAQPQQMGYLEAPAAATTPQYQIAGSVISPNAAQVASLAGAASRHAYSSYPSTTKPATLQLVQPPVASPEEQFIQLAQSLAPKASQTYNKFLTEAKTALETNPYACKILDGRSVTIDNLKITPESLIEIANLASKYGPSPDWRQLRLTEMKHLLEQIEYEHSQHFGKKK